MSEDISKEPLPPSRREPAEATADYLPLDYEEGPPYPRTVTAAGVIWIVFGGLILLNLVLTIALVGVTARGEGPMDPSRFSGQICGLGFFGLIGCVFIMVGIRSVLGAARGTLGSGIGSIVLSVLHLGVAASLAGMLKFNQAGMLGLLGTLLLTGGILALVGRSQYKLWREAQSTRNPFRK
jgi:hypothetical protein